MGVEEPPRWPNFVWTDFVVPLRAYRPLIFLLIFFLLQISGVESVDPWHHKRL